MVSATSLSGTIASLTYEMPEVPRDHSLESIGRACRVSRHHRVGRHDSLDPRISRIQSFSCNPEGQIFGRKDTAEMLILVDDKDAVRPLGCAELRGVCDADVRWDSKRRRRSQSRDGACLLLATRWTAGTGGTSARFGSFGRPPLLC